MFRLTDKQALGLVVTAILAALSTCSGCVSTMTWKIDADQHTTGNVEGTITPQPIPGLTPPPTTPTAQRDDAGDQIGATASASLAAAFRPELRFDLEPAHHESPERPPNRTAN